MKFLVLNQFLIKPDRSINIWDFILNDGFNLSLNQVIKKVVEADAL
jgi:hypothetical protein